MQTPEHAPGQGVFSHNAVTATRGERGGSGARFAVVVARFNQRITESLYSSAIDVLIEAGAQPDNIMAVQVPGAVEIPLAALELAQTERYAAIVVLGCVIRGETAHFDYVCSSVTDGCLRVQLDTGVPIGFGVITAETVDQAVARSTEARESGGRHNVGASAAYAALEMAGMIRSIRGS